MVGKERIMLEEYVYHGKEKLRCGYTTGSCAAAAAKAAAQMLFSGSMVHEVSLMTPKGIALQLPVLDPACGEGWASCAIEKDGGDDPDITKGILVYAKVSKMHCGQPRIEIDGGPGVGRVTKPGLDQPVGNAAINSVPRKMIYTAVEEMMQLYEYRDGIRVIVYVPGGEELAKKTFNPRIGIQGGISIIGTSGIVEPMSNQALIDTIKVEEKIRKEEGHQYLLLTLGNYGEQFLEKELPGILPDSVKCSNFIGEAVDLAMSLDFKGCLLVGHIGKLVKLGAGIMNTHSAQADGRMEVLVTCGVLAGADCQTLKKLPDCVTVDAALAILQEAGYYRKTMDILMERIQSHLDQKTKGELPVGAIVFSNQFGLIGKTARAEDMKKCLLEE